MITIETERLIDPALETALKTVARKLRTARLHREAALRWLVVLGFGLGLLALQWAGFISGSVSMIALAIAGVLVSARNGQMSGRARLDFPAAARSIELRHPELKHALLTALEQRREKDGTFSFLQRRVIHGAVSHAREHNWSPPEPRWARPHYAHIAAMSSVFVLLVIMLSLDPRLRSFVLHGKISATLPAVTVSPGDTEIERGSALVAAARFAVHLPREAQLVWEPSGGERRRAAMARSLSDPIYAFTWPSVNSDLTYWVEYDGKATLHFKLTVFDMPSLVRANAALHYPSYTGLADRTIENTKRVSAVEGTVLDYTFVMNKPMRKATLRDPEGKEQLELTPSNAQRTTFVAHFTLETSRHFSLQLEDDRGRKNTSQVDLRIDVLPNRRPDLKVTFPNGDQRPSPLEEIRVQAEAHDDFGLVDYGIGFAIGDAAPDYASLRKAAPAKQLDASFERLLSLETRGVKRDELVSWFAWADDFGPDGKIRRTMSDVFFAEVRALEEEFREEAANGADSQSQGAGGGQESAELLEIQRQISIAIWKEKQQSPAMKEFGPHVETIRSSQEKAAAQLSELRSKITNPSLRHTGEEAQGFMKQSEDALANAGKQSSLAPLDEAWKQSQGAYQALLKLQPRNYRVSQSRSRSGSQSKNNRNQRQLNQLEFKQSDSRYETESQAQAPISQQDREQLQILARLRELARRQEDLNQRLRELQTSLAAAPDEQKREEIRRELKRLEEEQRRMLSDADDAKQKMDQLPDNQQTRQTREQMDKTREEMRRSSDELSRGETSQALASGARAREQLEQLRDNFRKDSASKFTDQMRDARRAARELTDHQKEVEQQLSDLEKNGPKSLDDAEARNRVADLLEKQRKDREAVLDKLRQVSEDAEQTEPQLHRKLYDLLREQGQQETDKKLQVGAELLRHGLVPQSRELQPDVTKNLNQFRQGVEQAADSVLGDESAALRFAQAELNELSRQLDRERGKLDSAKPGEASNQGKEPGEAEVSGTSQSPEASEVAENGDPGTSEKHRKVPLVDGGKTANAQSAEKSGKENGSSPGAAGAKAAQNQASKGQGASPSGGESGGSGQNQSSATAANTDSAHGNDPRGSSATTDLSRALESFGGGGRGGATLDGPLTGDGFGIWNERLRTVEELMEDPDLRQRLGVARVQAEEIRREYKRRNLSPKWGDVNSKIVAPLNEARVFLHQELTRREQPQSLQPVDRDPVPERYVESVRKYYEALGR